MWVVLRQGNLGNNKSDIIDLAKQGVTEQAQIVALGSKGRDWGKGVVLTLDALQHSAKAPASEFV